MRGCVRVSRSVYMCVVVVVVVCVSVCGGLRKGTE